MLARHEGWEGRVHPSSKASAERGASVQAGQYVSALDEVAAIRLEFAELFGTVDVLLTPSSASLAWPVDAPYPAVIDGRDVGPRGAAVFATFVNAAGLPAISIPGTPSAEGLPIGLQLVGRFGDDLSLLALAAEFERAKPWHERWPDLAAKQG
jgi:aspartyl-tRNA(Asn)/glutamyl-tRNA(Gln) amidotransferase subunit A